MNEVDSAQCPPLTTRIELRSALTRALDRADIHDIHTHLYAPELGDLLRAGIDELLTYHYLVAEALRVAPGEIDARSFFALSKHEQANIVWEELFVRRSPISEAARGVVTCLGALGCDPSSRKLNDHRHQLATASPEQHLEKVLELAGVRTAVMTNDPFDVVERELWLTKTPLIDERFLPALRIDPLLALTDDALRAMHEMGYEVDREPGASSVAQIQRFLRDWITRMRPLYVAASLPPTFRLPHPVLEQTVLPVLAEAGLPLALMIGVQRGVNPQLGAAGDGVGHASLEPIAQLCTTHPDLRVLCTVLARENQHELVVLARKFRNLHVFGCWWFVNVPSLTDEITRMRIELLGHSFTPQHSDARVLEQLIYKWKDTRQMLARVLEDKYGELLDAGWTLEEQDVHREVAGLLGGNAMQFLGRL